MAIEPEKLKQHLEDATNITNILVQGFRKENIDHVAI